MIKNIIKNIVNDKQELYNFRTKLNKYDKKYLVYLFNNDKIMNKLDIFLDNIFRYDKIEFHNIPKIILFVSKICIENKNNYNINIINIIKIILEIIIYVSFDSNINDKIVLYDIIDTSIDLLKINTYEYNYLKMINWCK
jgi:hypothetical protein